MKLQSILSIVIMQSTIIQNKDLDLLRLLRKSTVTQTQKYKNRKSTTKEDRPKALRNRLGKMKNRKNKRKRSLATVPW